MHYFGSQFQVGTFGIIKAVKGDMQSEAECKHSNDSTKSINGQSFLIAWHFFEIIALSKNFIFLPCALSNI